MPHNRVLPPGLDEITFNEALEELKGVVGATNVSSTGLEGALEGPNGDRHYGDLWPLGQPDAHEPSGAIRPKTVDEVQGILKIANRYKLALWTISRGKNLGYGGSGAVVRGSVILDLHRMNKIIEVNEEYAYAIVEPGVSFFDLFEFVKEKSYALWPSAPALGWGSVVGNTLERGFGYTPSGEHTQQQCGMEIVLANGEIVRSGMGAMEGSAMWPLYKGGVGPSIDGLFYQSNLGVVTKLGIHLTPAPNHFLDCEVSVPKEQDLAFLVKSISKLERANVIQTHASIANVFRQATLYRDPEVFMSAAGAGMQGGRVSDVELAKIQQQKGWGYWKAQFAICGSSLAAVEADWEAVKEAFYGLPDVKFSFQAFAGLNGKPLEVKNMPQGEIPHNGLPSLTALPMLDIRGVGGGHIDFSPLFPPGGEDLNRWYQDAKSLFEEEGFDLWSDFHVYGRFIIAIIVIVYGPTEPSKAKTLFDRLVDNAGKHGVTEYRTHIDYMDEVASQFNFGDGAHGRLIAKIKDVVDPNGILSQGKSGIWTSKEKVASR